MNEKTPGNHDTADNDALGDLLRAADPAAAERSGLDPIERANLRQRIIATAEQSRRANAWSPGWSTPRPTWLVPSFAAVVLVTAIGLAMWSLQVEPVGTSDSVAATTTTPAPRHGADTTPGRPPIDDPATVAPDPDAAPNTTVAQPAAPGNVAAEGAAEPANIDEPADTASTAALAAPAPDVPSPPDHQTRTVQFVAPRGTRIIWTLDPDFESPIAGQEPRQEKTR